MSMRLTSAIVLGLAIVAGPLSGSAAWAQTPPAATADSLQAVIATAAATAKNSDHTVVRNGRTVTVAYASLTTSEKAAVLKAAVAGALSASGASDTVVAAALTQAVSAGVIASGLAVAVVADVAPALATQVAVATGATVTATTTTNGETVSVLTTLTNAPATGGDTGTTVVITPAPFDPCAGVTAGYC
jgi:hypothetical protein